MEFQSGIHVRDYGKPHKNHNHSGRLWDLNSGSPFGHSMWVSWWTKRGLGKFFLGFFPFSTATNFIAPLLHTHLIHFVSFHQPLWWCDRRGRLAPLLFADLQCRGFVASHPSTRPSVGHELRIIFILYYCIIFINFRLLLLWCYYDTLSSRWITFY